MKKHLYITLILFLSTYLISIYAQKEGVVYFNKLGNVVDTEIKGEEKCDVKITRQSVKLTYYVKLKGKWDKVGYKKYKAKSDSTYSVLDKTHDKKRKYTFTYHKKSDGLLSFTEQNDDVFYRKGTCKQLFPLLLEGSVIENVYDGNILRKGYYHNNRLVKSELMLKDGSTLANDVFEKVDRKPMYLMEDQDKRYLVDAYIKNLKVDKGVFYGEAQVGFVINENGIPNYPVVLKGVTPLLDSVAVHAVISALPEKFIPAKVYNKGVRYLQIIPIDFGNYNNSSDELRTAEEGIINN